MFYEVPVTLILQSGEGGESITQFALILKCLKCHLVVNLSTLSKNLKFNNLEKPKFHLIFAPIGFRNLWIRHNVLLWTPFFIKNVLGQRMPSKKLVCHQFLKFWMYWSRLLFNLLRRKKKLLKYLDKLLENPHEFGPRTDKLWTSCLPERNCLWLEVAILLTG